MSKSDCILKLKTLLAGVNRKMKLVSANKQEIFIFGAGNTAKLHAKCFEVENITPVAFLDNDSKKQGTAFISGREIMSPSSVRGRKDILVLICSAQPDVQKAISEQLEDLGLSFLTVDEYVFSKRANEILKCAELLDDERSAEIYADVIESRLTGRFPAAKFIDRDQYFALPQFSMVMDKEVFVDCGAFVGDTIENYLFSHDGTFGKIIAFEPDTVNYRAMEYRVERLNREWALSPDKIQTVKAGVGLKSTVGTIEQHNRLGSMIAEGTAAAGDSIKIYSLDDFFAEQKIDFLKADIESFEYDMLRGAEAVIRRDLPKIAVCIYHNASDMYHILLWLAGLNLDYKFSVRHHSSRYCDTVLYAYH